GAAVPGDGAIRALGHGRARRSLRRRHPGDLCRDLPVYPGADSGRGLDPDNHGGDVVLPACTGRRRKAADLLGHEYVGRDGGRNTSERSDRAGVPGRRRDGLSGPDREVQATRGVAAVSIPAGDRPVPRDRDAVAYSGRAAQSAVSRLHAAQRIRFVSRILPVLFYQRATAAFSEQALPARLQYGSARALLAVSPVVAVPLERVFRVAVQAAIQGRRSRVSNPVTVLMLGRAGVVLFHFLHDAGVL